MYIPESPVFITRYKVQEVQNVHMSPNQKTIYMEKYIFHFLDFVAGTKNGVFRYVRKNLLKKQELLDYYF